jgi:hypothetical protein
MVRVPTVRVLTPRRPYSTNARRNIVGIGGGPGTLDYDGEFVDAPPGSWLYIRTSRSAQGALRRVRVNPNEPPKSLWPVLSRRPVSMVSPTESRSTSRATADLVAAWPFYRSALFGGGREDSLSELLTLDAFGLYGTVHFLLDSATISEVDIGRRATHVRPVLLRSPTQWMGATSCSSSIIRRARSSRTTTNRSRSTARSTLTKWAVGTAYGAGSFVIRDGVVYACVLSHTSVVGVNDPPNNPTYWAPQPVPSTGFCILTGANACESIAEPSQSRQGSRVRARLLSRRERAESTCAATTTTTMTRRRFKTRTSRTSRDRRSTITSRSRSTSARRSRPADDRADGYLREHDLAVLQGAFLSPEPITPFAGFNGWFSDIKSLDFHPASPSALWIAREERDHVRQAQDRS